MGLARAADHHTVSGPHDQGSHYVPDDGVAATSRRVIAKRGLIRRNTLELNHQRVEGLAVNQGVIARVFNAGTIVVNGTGGTRQGIPFISNPMEFRRNALETIDNSP